jgi:hypothetical protein
MVHNFGSLPLSLPLLACRPLEKLLFLNRVEMFSPNEAKPSLGPALSHLCFAFAYKAPPLLGFPGACCLPLVATALPDRRVKAWCELQLRL